MAYRNRIRLPFELKRPQFPEERTSFRKANGVTQTLSVIIRKTYEGATDFLPEKWHERLKIALGHDEVRVEGDKYLGNIAQDGDYEINWPDFLDYPTAPARFKAEVTPFDASNSNCQTCEEATQVDLENDTFPDPLEEDTDYQLNVSTNDTICCYPAVFSLVSFNSDYLDSASIDETTGILSIHTGTGLVAANGMLLATYRVTCPNGGYDEANVYADIDGSEEGCLAPTGVSLASATTTTLEFPWTAPTSGVLTYYWEIYEGDEPVGSPVQTGTSITDDPSLGLLVTGLTENTDYYFQVRQACESSNSNFVGVQGATSVESENCGQYSLAFNDGTGVPSNYAQVSFTNCSGSREDKIIFNNSSTLVCALQTAPGSPFWITAVSGVTVTYIGEC